ncbi:hypothetical protein K0U83_16965 [bacterium]|nr:hypothetical protein [bacterium]
MWQVVVAFLSGLFAGYKARSAAKAGSELPQGEAQVKAASDNVESIEGELKRTKPVEAPAPSASTLPSTAPPTSTTPRLVN